MKNAIVLIFICLVIMLSCGKDDLPTCENCNFTCLDDIETDVLSEECIDEWDCSFKVFGQSEVDITEREGIGAGDKIVFQMNNSTEGAMEIADDEYTNILVFELDASRTSFSAEDEQLKNLNMHYREICFCLDTEFKEISSGCIQGERQSDGTWFVQGSLIVPNASGDFTVNLEALFLN